MKRMKRVLSLLLALCMLFALVPMAAMGAPLVPSPHIVGDETPPTESPVSGFTVGFAGPGDYVAPVHEFWENGKNSFFFVTGDPARAGEHGTAVTVTYQGMDFNATVHYIPRQDISGIGGGAGAPSVPLFDVSPLVSPAVGPGNQSSAPVPFGFDDAHRIRFESNTVYFFDAGAFVDTDDFSVVNRFNVANVAFVGLHRDAATGEPLTTFYKTPAGTARGGNFATGFMARNVLQSPNIHIENIIWDGSGIDMVRQGGTLGGQLQSSRGEYFWFISNNATNFVARDVILQNIGSRTALPLMENLTASNQRKNVAINIFTAGSINSGTEGTQRNFENLTIRNTRTMTGFGIIQFNRTSGNYFLNLNVANPNADGTGIAHSTFANTYPIKIEHRPISDNQVAATQRDIVFAGTLTVPNHANSAVYIQDYRYQNILVPENFAWALLRTANGGDNTAAIRVFDHKRPQATNHALLQLDTGYWVVENQTAAPNLQTQLNNINTIIGVNAPFANVIPATNIKMIANAAGEIGGFTVPNFPASHAETNIVALLQTDTPAATVHAARAHASGASPAVGAAEFVTYSGDVGGITLSAANAASTTIFNFDFKTPAEWTIEDATTGPLPGIVNFTIPNSGRNLFLQYVPLSHPVTFQLNGGNVSGSTENITHNVNDGAQIGVANVPAPSRASHTFAGWQEVDANGNLIGSVRSSAAVAELVVEGPRTFVAQWTPTSGNNNQGGGSSGQDPWREAFLIGRTVPAGQERPIDPRGNITRAEVATIFFRLISDEARAAYWMQENPFDDVTLERWFNNAISTTTNMGLFEGIGDDLFAPERNITRGELAAVLVRFMEREQIGAFTASFASGSDEFDDIANHWARAYINEAARQGWVQGDTVNGVPTGTFRPGQPLTRAETAAMINRMFERLIETPDCRLYDMVTWPDNQNENAWYFLYMYMASNSYTYRWRADSDRYKALIEIIEPRDWSVLERPDSRPGDILR